MYYETTSRISETINEAIGSASVTKQKQSDWSCYSIEVYHCFTHTEANLTGNLNKIVAFSILIALA